MSRPAAVVKRGPATVKRVTCPHCGAVKIVPVQQTGQLRCVRCFTPHRIQQR